MIHNNDDWEQIQYIRQYREQQKIKKDKRQETCQKILQWIRHLIRKGNNNGSK